MFKNFADEVPIIFMVSVLVYILCFPVDPKTALETFVKLLAFICVGYVALKFIIERWL